MRTDLPTLASLVASLALTTTACSFQPQYERAASPVSASWPMNAGDGSPRQATSLDVRFQTLVTDVHLRQLVETAIVNNADVRLALANIEAARAQYRISRAALLPEIGGSAGFSRSSADTARTQYSTQLGSTSFEIDLFGRLNSLKDAALNRFLASEETARAARLTLIGDVAQAWLSHAADNQLLRIAQDTRTSAQNSVRLTRARLERGIVPRSDLLQAETILGTAEADIARLRTVVAQDVSALERLIGQPVSRDLLASDMVDALAGLGKVQPGLSSEVLLQRPDVLSAEYELKAANGDIGAARAALFPRISLTGLLGFSSPALSSLFTDSGFTYSASTNAQQSIFSAGAGRANVAYARAQQQASLARYQRAIQTAFQDAADALARADTLDDEVAARRATVTAASDNVMLAQARYSRGLDPFLTLLDAQRTLYAAQRQLVAVQLADGGNRVTLYQALGGESTP